MMQGDPIAPGAALDLEQGLMEETKTPEVIILHPVENTPVRFITAHAWSTAQCLRNGRSLVTGWFTLKTELLNKPPQTP